MMLLKSKIADKSGFTLIEIIVSLVAAGILSIFYFHFMGTAMDFSWKSVELVAGETEAELVMETIIADYVDRINDTPDTALAGVRNADYTQGGNLKYVTGITMVYVRYDSINSRFEVTDPQPTYYLRVTVHTPGKDLTTMLAKSRTKASDPAVFF